MELDTDVGVAEGTVGLIVGVTGVYAVGNRVGGMRVTVGGTAAGPGTTPEQPAEIRNMKRKNALFLVFIMS
jgi:hypothetical protein